MLKAMRNGAKAGFLKFILLGLMALAVGGLVLTDVGGFFNGGVSNNLVAKGKGIKISTVQFDQTVRRILARQGISPQEAYDKGLINQILNSEIQTRLMLREALKLGINVDDNVVMSQISEIAEPLAQNGVSKKDALRQILRSQGVSEKEFIQSIRQEMTTSLLRGALVSGSETISQNQAEDLYQYRNETRGFEGVVLKDSSIPNESISPTKENLEKYYDANKTDFMISEKRSVTVATLKKEMVTNKVNITGEELQKAYDEAKDTYKRPERRKLAQAIVDRQTDAQEIAKKVNVSKNLKAAVKEVTGNESPFLGENEFEQGGLLEEISKPVFAAEKGAVIGPIQTALGWHVLVLEDILEPQIESFDKVKASIKDGLLQDRAMEDLIDTANAMDDRLASGEALDAVVKDIGLTTEKFSNFNQAGLDENGKDLFSEYQGDRAQILDAAFNFNEGEASPVVELADGRFITVRVDETKESAYEPFDDVKEILKNRWVNEQKRLANRQRAEELFAAVKSSNNLSEAVKAQGLAIEKFNDLKRATTPPAPISLPALREIFESAKGAPIKTEINGGVIVGRVTSIDLPSIKDEQKEAQSIMMESKQVLPQETVAQLVNYLSRKYKVRVNERVLKQIYGTPVEQN